MGVGIVHPLTLLRLWEGTFVGAEAFPKGASGWSARAEARGVVIEGGGWVDVPLLLDRARERWLATGKLEPRRFSPAEARGKTVLWCGGMEDFTGPVWGGVEGVAGAWQGVRGDVLTVRVPGLTVAEGEIGPRFLLPLGSGRFRWGATHESDVLDQSFRPEARALLERELLERLAGESFEVESHAWGVRPASRKKHPLVVAHPDEPGWTLFNGFGGRGVALIPRWLSSLVWRP